VGIVTIVIFPTVSWGLDARLRWTPSADTRVQGYNVYIREATKPYAMARDAGPAQRGPDGSLSWVVTGLSPATAYYIAVTAYTASRVESLLSNELSLGAPNPCVQDACASLTQCTLQNRPDGTACGVVGAAGCGSTCVAGTCAGLAEHGFSVDRLKLRRSTRFLRVAATGRFADSALFDPGTSGLEITIADDAGGALAVATVPATALRESGETIKATRGRGASPVQISRLIARRRGGDVLVKLALRIVPPPDTVPTSASVKLETGQLCLAASPADCHSRARSLSCG